MSATNKKGKKSLPLLLLAGFGVICVAFSPHFQSGLFYGLDSSFHLYRIYSMADALRYGIFPVKIHPTMCYGYGYGSGFFYSNAFLYFPALLILAGVSLVTAYKIFAFVIMTGIFWSSYYCAYKLCTNRAGAFLGASLFLFSSKVFSCFYMEMAVGTMCAAIFLPLCYVGMYLFLEREESPTMLIIGFTGLVYCHTLSLFISFIICLGILIPYLGKIIRHPKMFLQLSESVVLVLMMGMEYLIPMLQQLHVQLLKVNAPWTYSEKNVETVQGLLERGGIGVSVLVILIIDFAYCIYALVACIRNLKNKECLLAKSKREALPRRKMLNDNFYIILFTTLSIAGVLLTFCQPFWHFMNTNLRIHFLQFPYRIYYYVSSLITMAFAGQWGELCCFIRTKLQKVAFCLLIMMSVVCSFIQYYPYFTQIDSELVSEIEEGSIAGIGGGEEWLPINCDRKYLTDAETATGSNGEKVTGKKSRGDSFYTFDADPSELYYDVPFIYYRGFIAETDTGETLEVDENTDTGMVRVFVPSKEKYNGAKTLHIRVYYRNTRYMKASYAISFWGFMIGISLLIKTLVCHRN